MTNYTMNNEKKAIDELDFDELDIVSGGGFFDSAKKVSKNFWEELLGIIL